MLGKNISSADVKSKIDEIRKDTFTNDETGNTATFSKEGRTKIICGVAVRLSVENGYTANDHYTAVYNTPQLFKTAVLSNENEDVNHQMLGINWYSSFCVINGKPAVAVFTVKVTNNAGEKVYTLQLVELKNPAGILPEDEKTRLPATAGLINDTISQVNTESNKNNSVPKKIYKRSSHKKGFEEVDTSALAEKFKDIYNKINEHGEPDFTQLDENEVYMQRAAEPERDLVAYHNISADNLRKPLASGGLPVPSIAITQMVQKQVQYSLA